MAKIIDILKIIIIIVAILSGCTKDLHTGKYVVTDVRGRTVNLKGVEGDIYFPTDTLKKGDVVFVKKVHKEKNANIW